MKLPTTLMVIALTTGCVDVDEPLDEPGEVTPLFGDEARPPLYGVIEVGNTWTKDSLSVCWLPEIFDSPDPEVQALRAQGKDTVNREWGRVGRVRFTGWGRCAVNSTSDIRIGFETDLSVSGHSKIGTDALLVPAGQATMGLTFAITIPPECGPDVGNLCDDSPETLDAREIRRFDHLILHEFGHALGLRHEHAHEGSTCDEDETLDQGFFDGESVFTFDADSVMSYCSSATVLSSGDIRALHTLYPGVVALYTDTDFRHGNGGTGLPIFLGPGTVTSTALPALANISSIVVPPGYTVTICNATTCAIATTNRVIPAAFNNQLRSIQITPVVLGADLFGYQGATEAFVQTRNAPFSVLADNQLSSLFPGPTRAARVCTEANGGGTCSGVHVGGSIPDGFRLGAGIFTSVSHVEVSNRVLTYSSIYSGASHALGLGVYKASTNAPFLVGVRTLAIHGLEVRACTEEGVATPFFPGGAGDCRTYTQSVDRLTQPSPQTTIRFLQVKLPQVIGT